MRPILNTARFVREFIRNPQTTGAIAPSSPGLARRMLDGIGFEKARVVVEYGPGTGAFTGHVLARLAPDARFFAVELNHGMAEEFRRRYPFVTLHHECVTNIRAICDSEGVDHIDCIVSGLPWAAFDDKLQDAILDTMMTVLRPGGHFVTFAYLHGLVLPKATSFRKKLRKHFRDVAMTRPVWLNVPPALCYSCTR